MARRRRDSGGENTSQEDVRGDTLAEQSDADTPAPVAAPRAARAPRTARVARMTAREFARTLGALGKAFVHVENQGPPVRRTKAEWQARYDKFLTTPR